LKQIETLIEDIHSVLENGAEVSDDIADRFAASMRDLIINRLKRGPREPTLRMSNIGKPARQLWYEINMPEAAERMQPNNYIKFLIGDVYEEVLLALAEIAGHEVSGRQDEQEIVGIKGHRDAVIDGVTADVKSASPYSTKKFEQGLTHDQDAFGYIPQLQSYLQSGQTDEKVKDKSRAVFFVGNKVTGDLVLDVHQKSDIPLTEIYEYKKEVVTRPEPPDRCFEPEPYGKSGNMALGVNCSYCAFKKTCWPGLRMFLYNQGTSTKPTYFTHVELEPKVNEGLE